MNRQHALVLLFGLLPAAAMADNDYPTLDRVDHVLNCIMAHGGQMIENVHACSCEIDYIASKLSFEEYSDARTVESFRNTPGDKGGVFRDSEQGRNAGKKLEEARAGAAKHCFVKVRTGGKAKATEPKGAESSPGSAETN